VTRAETPMGAGLRAAFRVAAPAEVDTAGEDLGGGRRRWDLSAALADAPRVEVRTAALDGAWFAADFPSATYVSALAGGSELLGVYEAAEGALRLLGVVSPTREPGAFTRLVYDPPVDLLRFPMRLGDAWRTTAVVSGTFEGLPALYTETHAATVGAAGDALVPFSSTPFAVLRVDLELTKVVGALVTTLRSQSYLAECFGPVAAARSEEYELDVEFSRAAELRGLSP
jgi:hypothetical protein